MSLVKQVIIEKFSNFIEKTSSYVKLQIIFGGILFFTKTLCHRSDFIRFD